MLDALVAMYNALWSATNAYNFYPIARYEARNLKRRIERNTDATVTADPSNILDILTERPKISVLLPAYKEERTLGRVVRHTLDCSYPRDRLELILLTEKDDVRTTEIAKELEKELVPQYNVKQITVEETHEPRGKPRALNQGLKHATGDVIGVLDAEDLPDYFLFDEVAKKLNEKDVDVVQARLDMANDYDGLLSTYFRGEYGFWYRIHLPSLAECRFPVPLSGSSNFFRRELLEKKLDGWDSFNRTEDFDAGLKIYNEGLNPVRLIDSVTTEESPNLKGWIKQRTRWQRGKTQTIAKILRDPPKSFEKKFHSIMTGIVAHGGPINMVGVATSAVAYMTHTQLDPVTTALTYLNLGAIAVNSALQSYGYLLATKGKEVSHRKLKALVNLSAPVYWVLQWIAEGRAIKQSLFDGHIFWEKTEHKGLHFESIDKELQKELARVQEVWQPYGSYSIDGWSPPVPLVYIYTTKDKRGKETKVAQYILTSFTPDGRPVYRLEQINSTGNS